LKFSESNMHWQHIPAWADFLISFGYFIISHPTDSRIIAVVSMPVDSAGAGLITLGAIRRRMELESSNDLSTHFQRILVNAQEHKKTVLRKANLPGRYLIDEVDDRGILWVKRIQKTKQKGNREIDISSDERISINARTAASWQFSGEAPVSILHGNELGNQEFYSHLLERGGNINQKNFVETDSAICLAGRMMGENATRNTMRSIEFKIEDMVVGLDQLLTVQNWMSGTVSRITFFNPRNNSFDRATGPTKLVVADGDSSFLEILSRQEFASSHVVAVIHRTVERDRLEKVGARLEDLHQWYDPVNWQSDEIPEKPKAINISLLKKRVDV